MTFSSNVSLPQYVGLKFFFFKKAHEGNHSLKPGISATYNLLTVISPSKPSKIMTAKFVPLQITKYIGQSVISFF